MSLPTQSLFQRLEEVMSGAYTPVKAEPTAKAKAKPCSDLRKEFNTCFVREAPDNFCFIEAFTLRLCLENSTPTSHS
jgi:hypothetical protein